MENLIISFNAIAPMFLIIAAGVLCRKVKLIAKDGVEVLNKLVYWIFCPALLFNNIYVATHQEGGVQLDAKLLAYLAGAIVVVYGVTFAITVATVKENPRRGAVIHGIFRSNFVILGLPIVLALFPPEETAIVSVAATVVVPIFNVLAVFTLENFRGGKVTVGQVLLSIAKNPLIIGTVLGIVFWLTGLTLPGIVETSVADLAKTAMPIGLLALGAAIEAKGMGRNLKAIGMTTLARLVLVPAVTLPVAALAFGIRGVELATVMAVFASPAAINSYTMAAQMGGDAELAGGIVMATSALSCVTIFLWTFLMKQVGWF